MTDELMEKIDALDEEISHKKFELLKLRNEWLTGKGWEITCEGDEFISAFFYHKNGCTFICEHDAIDYEING